MALARQRSTIRRFFHFTRFSKRPCESTSGSRRTICTLPSNLRPRSESRWQTHFRNTAIEIGWMRSPDCSPLPFDRSFLLRLVTFARIDIGWHTDAAGTSHPPSRRHLHTRLSPRFCRQPDCYKTAASDHGEMVLCVILIASRFGSAVNRESGSGRNDGGRRRTCATGRAEAVLPYHAMHRSASPRARK